ncbi:hypothetical protein H5400_17490 [Rhodococcus wratislaviensis]|nr:hypothetical protein [Rhodococcus sp. 3A]MBC2894596.1 hypothetical protein [Rhodococcus sp. 4CII]
MITAADVDYHPSEPSARTWAETIVLVFSVPEAGILGNAYVLSRPNVGATISSVVVHSGLCTQPYQIDFTDPQMHVPAPEVFSKFTLESGLSLEATNAPRDFRVSYENALGVCRFDLQFQGLHEPFDVHDASQNPLVAGADGPIDTGLGDVWANGHYDMIGHVTGTLELRGKEYQVDCFDGMDRSWGPRAELGHSGAAWIHVTLGPDFGLHLGMALGIRNGEVVYEGLRFGYVVEDGEVFGITHATVEASRVDLIAVNNHITAVDVRGKKHEFFGTAVGGAPWYSFSPAYVSCQSLFRYQVGNRVGYAEATDVLGLEFLAERLSSHGRLRAGARP